MDEQTRGQQEHQKLVCSLLVTTLYPELEYPLSPRKVFFISFNILTITILDTDYHCTLEYVRR